MNGSYIILLDGKPIKTPQGKKLQCESKALAQKIADEWNAQVDVINTDAMPLTRLLNITLDRIPLDRAALLTDIASYAETDLLFYREPSCSPLEGEPNPSSDLVGGNLASYSPAKVRVQSSPPTKIVKNDFDSPSRGELGAIQSQHFTPVLEWAQKTYGLKFNLTEDIIAVEQPAASLKKLREIFSQADDHELAALAMMVPILGSALLTLAVWKEFLEAEAALIAARMDEAVQEQKWGIDPLSTASWEGRCKDARAAAFFLTRK